MINFFPHVSEIQYDNLTLKFHNINYLTDYRIRTFKNKEPETLDWIDDFKSDSVFYDIGANVGLYSIYAAKKKDSLVYAFEPSFLNLELLFKNIDENELNNNIQIMPVALNDSDEVNKFNLSDLRKAGALSSFGKDFDQYGKKLLIQKYYYTLGMSLDNLVNIFNLKKPDYLKIDVDGIEHLILQGGKKTLSNSKSVLLEITESFKSQSENCYKILNEYNFHRVENDYFKDTDSTQNQIWIKKI